MLPVEDPNFSTVEKSGENRSFIDLDLGGQAQGVVLPHPLLKTSKGAASFGDAVVYILGHSCVFSDDTSQVREMFHCIELVSPDDNVGWGVCFTRRFLKHGFSFLQADGNSEGFGCLAKRLKATWRASSVRALWSAKSRSRMSSSSVFVRARSLRRVKHAPISPKPYVYFLMQIFLGFLEHHTKENRKQGRG